MIYDKSGNALSSAYDYSSDQIEIAYDVEGNVVFSSDAVLKVMTYNCGQWYTGGGDNVPTDKDAAYYALQNGMIASNDPDVLLIQEYWKVFSKTGRTAKSMLDQYFPYIHEQGGNSGYFGRCICSKYPISNYTVRTYSNNANRYYDTCVITVNGVAITFVNTHLDTDETKRLQNIAELVPFLQTLNTFVCAGDMNTMITPDTANTSSTQYINNVKPFVDAGFKTANFQPVTDGFKVTYIDGTWYGYLDNIYASASFGIDSVYVDITKETDGLSDKIDHMPLIATLQIGG